jgi:phosphonopyruvate decarboxylase
LIDAQHFLTTAKNAGFDFYTGVPCSLLTPLIDQLVRVDATEYVGATSEGEAMAIASGAWLAGRRPIVFMQNSGLGNAVNPITSLNHPFRIPALILVTWRGRPGVHDEPQHKLMGEITPRLLDLIGVRHAELPTQPEALAYALEEAQSCMEDTGLPFVLIVREDCFAPERSTSGYGRETSVSYVPTEVVRHYQTDRLLSRIDALRVLVRAAPDSAALIVTTGKTGRELFTIGDRPQQFYLVGSMGCASAVAFGAAFCTRRTVVAIDGDGAALMKLGN